jgi:hypothetical protein
MPQVALASKQQETRDRLEDMVRAIKSDKPMSDSARNQVLDEMAHLAHELHIELKEQGHEPRHHGYMIKNRGMKPSDLGFYRHVHPVEDLLKFLDNEHANDDPVDSTIGERFRLRVFSRRWAHEDVYVLTRTEAGWAFTFLTASGPCDTEGRPYLFTNLKHDGISYPADLGDHIHWIWRKAKDEGLSAEEVQMAFDDLSRWVSETERSSPTGGIWTGLKA